MKISSWIFFISVSLIISSCSLFPKDPVDAVVSTTSISGITQTGATGGGNVTSDGNSTISKRGVVWSTSPNPSVSLGTKTSDGTGTGVFTSTITGLTPSTKYYVRAYAVNEVGTAYGNEVSFTTSDIPVPVLTTASITAITATTATGGGNISSDGGSAITSRGIVWSTTSGPTINLSTNTSDGSGIGSFTSSITGLSPNTKYFVRAYATNSSGTGYGSEVSFTTDAAVDLALVFDGVDDYVAIDAGSSSVEGSYTIEVWAKPLHATNNLNILSTRLPGESTFDMKFQGGTKIHGDIGTGSTWITTNADADLEYSVGIWYHIAYVVTSTGYTIYINGNDVASGSFAFQTPLLFDSNHIPNIGRYAAGVEQFQGEIDEVRIWDTARTWDEINDNMMTTLSGDEAGLVAYYPFKSEAAANGNNSGIVNLADYSTNGNNGTLQNFDLSGSNSNWTTTVPFKTSFAIGDEYQGGIIAYLDNSGKHGFIVAKTNQGTADWGCPGTDVPGASNTGIGSGKQNTIDILNGCSSTGIAARLCGDLVLNGYSDWLLPSKDELNQLYLIKATLANSGAAMDPYDYWSSSEVDSFNAWIQWFNDGAQYSWTKFEFVTRVRAIRYF